METGAAFGPWLLDKQLGVGGMGEVWLATHRVLGTQIAVKILASELTRDPRFRERFISEAKVQARLSHPHIAHIQDFLEEGGRFAILMEWIPGGTVADVIDRAGGPLSIEQTLKWAKQALEALDFAHRHGVIHRDVKPANLMLDGTGDIKVTDFGIAIALGAGRMTTTGRSIGTPQYMSPEQILRPQSVDHRTDVYSMGVVLYEMLAGRVPFDADTDYTLQRLHIEAPPPPLRDLNPLVPEWLESVALRCLAKSPDDRFAGCASVAATLQQHPSTTVPMVEKPTTERLFLRLQAGPTRVSKRTHVLAVCGLVAMAFVAALWLLHWRRARNLDEIAKRADSAYDRQDYATAAPLYQQLADSGRAGAMTSLGYMYEKGRGLAQSDQQAVTWFRKAAEKGDPKGMRDLGWVYANGRGVARDYAQAVGWFRKAAERDEPFGMTELGAMYANGWGVARDYGQAVAWFRKAAEKGDTDAMSNLGVMYENGQGVAQDYAQAVAWYRKAAEKGEPKGMNELGAMYESGQGVAKDFAQAVAWYRNAAEDGATEGMRELGRMYENGRGVTKDYSQAADWYRKAAEKGDPTGMSNLGTMYRDGRGVAKDDAQAVAWYRKAAEKGDPWGTTDLGWMYEVGRGVAQDDAQAVAWYQKAVALGNEDAKAGLKRLGRGRAAPVAPAPTVATATDRVSPKEVTLKLPDVPSAQALDEMAKRAGAAWARQDYAAAVPLYQQLAVSGRVDAMTSLGRMYANGEGVAQDDSRAVAWLREAAENGSTPAMISVGEMYASGRGVSKDDAQAVAWFRKAAESGDAVGMFDLGQMYVYGRGVVQDDIQAAAWYRKAADNGSLTGMWCLGWMYENGRGVTQDYAQAVTWYRKAAEGGDAVGMYDLGVMYEQGRGVARDDAQAVAWLRKAAALGHEGAKASLNQLGR